MRRSHALASIALATTLGFGQGVGGSTSRTESTDERASLEVRVVDQDGRPIAARVRVERTRLSFGHRVLETGLADALPATFRIAHEHVRVVATHGPEWSIASREVALEKHRTNRVRLALVRSVDRSPFVSADLHVHTDASPDGSISLANRLRSVAAEDLDHVVLTDHNVLTRAPDGDATITGVEITTTAPEIGHFNAFPIDRVPTYRGTSARRIFDEVHAVEGALVQINHPRIDDHIAYFELADLTRTGTVAPGYSLDADLLEVWNGYDLARRERMDEVFHDWLRLRALGHPMIATGGSDAHGISGPVVGTTRTYVHPRGDESWIDALRRGAAFVSNGPILDVRVGDSAPGDSLMISGRTRVSIDVDVRFASHISLDRLEVFRGTHLVRTVRLGPTDAANRVRQRVILEVAPGDELVVRVSGDRTMDDLIGRPDVLPCAFTNPIRFISLPPNEL